LKEISTKCFGYEYCIFEFCPVSLKKQISDNLTDVKLFKVMYIAYESNKYLFI